MNELDAACQYNLAASCQALGQRTEAARHYRKALALGLSGKGPEPFLLQDATIFQRLSRMEDRFSLPVRNESVFGTSEIAAIAENTFLRCALGATIIRGIPLEAFLTGLRQALLRLADSSASHSVTLQDDVLGLLCALAEQCFLNEYVFAKVFTRNRQLIGYVTASVYARRRGFSPFLKAGGPLSSLEVCSGGGPILGTIRNFVRGDDERTARLKIHGPSGRG